MPEHVSTLQLTGAAVLTAAGVVWAVIVMRLLRRFRAEAITGRRRAAAVPVFPVLPALPALPDQPQAGPSRESVELSPEEQDAFAGLVRRLGGR
ncbi:hypothetical protein [Streptomyces cellostaticus]|uniref:hypothetical protein n=1 Tax=Streptomyces TaxID=1883 RepID=UPI0020267092|nr:hypothetical protein [Streptomyces cellostaticus]